MKILDEALEYANKGLSIIPCDKEKKPLTSWLEYQTRIATEEEIKAWYNKWPNMNIGIVTGKISNLTVLDCDSEDAIREFEQFYQGQTPTVKTPRGKHFYFQYAEGTRNTVKIKNLDLDLRSEGGYVVAPPSVNGNGNAYAWINNIKDFALDSFKSFNNLLKDSTSTSIYIHPHGEQIENPTAGLSTSVLSLSTNNDNCLQKSTDIFIKGRRDEDMFHVANALVRGGCNPVIMHEVLKQIALNCKPPFDLKDVEAKIKSALDRASRKERNVAEEVHEFVLSTNGNFLSTEVSKVLQLSTRQDIKNLSIILKRLCEKGIIEKYGDKNGCWRKINKDVDIIDWQNATEDEYPVRFPLQLHDLVKLYPGNIAILAGASNTGKTAFMLEIIRLNQKNHKIIYFNSEMAAAELRLRLQMFHEVCPLEKWTFQAIERSSNFADVIDPDAMNVIDFMEVYDDFWKIGGWIRDIHSKLKKGIAIIAIQKKSSTKNDNQRYGRGGELTLEKPRLYLAMDRGKIEIVKAKIWRDHERNPNGLSRKFKLVNGWKFLPAGDWQSEEEEKYAGFTRSGEIIKKGEYKGFIHED